MYRERALKLLLIFVGLALIACIYPLATSLAHFRNSQVSPGDQMILGIYFPIGIFLLLAVRNPSANRSLIICFGWSTLAHVAVMLIQGFQAQSIKEDWLPLSFIALLSVALIALAPPKEARDRVAAAKA